MLRFGLTLESDNPDEVYGDSLCAGRVPGNIGGDGEGETCAATAGYEDDLVKCLEIWGCAVRPIERTSQFGVWSFQCMLQQVRSKAIMRLEYELDGISRNESNGMRFCGTYRRNPQESMSAWRSFDRSPQHHSGCVVGEGNGGGGVAIEVPDYLCRSESAVKEPTAACENYDDESSCSKIGSM